MEFGNDRALKFFINQSSMTSVSIELNYSPHSKECVKLFKVRKDGW